MNEFDEINGGLPADETQAPVQDDAAEETAAKETAQPAEAETVETAETTETPKTSETDETSDPADMAGSEAEASAEDGTEAPAVYRWEYAAQNDYDKEQAAKKDKKTGIAVYAIIMAAVFAIGFGLLLGVLLVTDRAEWSGEADTGPIMTDAELGRHIEQARKSVVLIQVTTATGGGTGGFGSTGRT